MRRVFYYAMTIVCTTAGVVSITFVNSHPEMGIIAVLGLWGAHMYNRMYVEASERAIKLRDEFFLGLEDDTYDYTDHDG